MVGLRLGCSVTASTHTGSEGKGLDPRHCLLSNSNMPGMLNVYTLPKLVEPEELLGGTAVVIDVLRSTTTIVHALAAGAEK